jgi:hypothetical protein
VLVGAAGGVVPWFDGKPIVHEGIASMPSSITLSKHAIPSPICIITSLYRYRAMIRWAGGAIGADTAMVEQPIHPSKAVKVD